MANYKKYMIKLGNGNYHRGSRYAGTGGISNIEHGMQYDTLGGVRGIYNSLVKNYGPNSNGNFRRPDLEQFYHEVIKDMKIIEVTFVTSEVEI